MRGTSAHRVGPDGKYDPNGQLDANSNWDNKNVLPGKTKVLLDAKGPGVVTHIWMTFLGPEPHAWAKPWKHHAAGRYARQVNEALERHPNIAPDLRGAKVSPEWLLPKVWHVIEEAPHVFRAAVCNQTPWGSFS